MNVRGIGLANSERRWRSDAGLQQQRGVVAIIAALSMVVLVGFIGLALDLGKLFVTKTELQNSADACALAAARELTGANNNQLVLAEAAGIATGTANDVWFQSEEVVINSSDVTFSDQLNGAYAASASVANVLDMRFARCTVGRPGIANWFIQVIGIGDQQVNATAVARMLPGQTTCAALPIAVCESRLSSKKIGDWLETALDPQEGITGDFLWAGFDGQSAKEIKDILIGNGECNLPVIGEEIGSPGVKTGAYDAWNTRFGVYKGQFNITNAKPDYSGFAYTAKSWPSCKNAFVGGDFASKRASYVPIQNPTKNSTGLKVVPPASSSSVSAHINNGSDRRIVSVPVVNCDEFKGGNHKAGVRSWACVLMLHPLDQNADLNAYQACSSGPGNRAFLEYLGNSADPSSPCASSGIPGNPTSLGTLVPTLVQ